MSPYYIPEIGKNVFSVGVKDWNRRIFDALVNTPYGTSYNSYLVVGEEKTALIDSVEANFEREFLGKLGQIIKLKDINYLVMNHAEPDHAGLIPIIMKESDAVLITTEKGAKMAQSYYKIMPDRIKIVRDNDTISLGGKTIQFIEAPWLHWPETMFTYLVEDGILFSCDFFGAHTAFGIYDSDSEDLLTNAKRYFGEIMMPYKQMGKKAIDRINGLDIKVIAPSHGPIYRELKSIINAYKEWTLGKTKNKVLIAYVSMWGSTESMIGVIAESLRAEGIEVCMYNLTIADTGEIAKDLVDSSGIVLGFPTVLASVHPLAAYAVHLVKALRPPLKYAAILSSYGWAPGAVKQASDMISQTKIEIVGSVEVNGKPTEEDNKQIEDIGKMLASRIKNEKA